MADQQDQALGYVWQSAEHGQWAPSGKVSPAIDVDSHNRAVEAAELARWGGRPDGAIGYYAVTERETGNREYGQFRARVMGCPVIVKTWIGTVIGHGVVTAAYQHNFGGRFVAITVHGTNGARYHGRASYDNGTCVRLHRAK